MNIRTAVVLLVTFTFAPSCSDDVPDTAVPTDTHHVDTASVDAPEIDSTSEDVRDTTSLDPDVGEEVVDTGDIGDADGPLSCDEGSFPCNGECVPEPSEALAAQLAVTPTRGAQVLVVEGTASATGGAGNYRYYWDFDSSDGVQVDGLGDAVTHPYGPTGTYTVTLTVVDADGTADSATEEVVVEATEWVPSEPIALGSDDPRCTDGEPLVFENLEFTGETLHLFEADNCSGITFVNCYFHDFTATEIGPHGDCEHVEDVHTSAVRMQDVQNVTFDRCWFDNLDSAIALSDVDGFSFRNSVMSRITNDPTLWGNGGIMVADADQILVEHSQFSDIGHITIADQLCETEIDCSDGHFLHPFQANNSTNVVFRNNLVFNVPYGSVQVWGCWPADVEDVAAFEMPANLTIEHNVLRRMGTAEVPIITVCTQDVEIAHNYIDNVDPAVPCVVGGIAVRASRNVDVHHNTVANVIVGFSGYGTPDTRIWNNTFVGYPMNDDAFFLHHPVGISMHYDPELEGPLIHTLETEGVVTIVNNVIRGFRAGIYLYNIVPDTIDENVFWVSPTEFTWLMERGTPYVVGTVKGMPAESYEAVWGVGNRFVEPRLSEPQTGDFELSRCSPLIESGAAGVTPGASGSVEDYLDSWVPTTAQVSANLFENGGAETGHPSPWQASGNTEVEVVSQATIDGEVVLPPMGETMFSVVESPDAEFTWRLSYPHFEVDFDDQQLTAYELSALIRTPEDMSVSYWIEFWLDAETEEKTEEMWSDFALPFASPEGFQLLQFSGLIPPETVGISVSLIAENRDENGSPCLLDNLEFRTYGLAPDPE